MIEFASYAKLNLFLHITGKREDGYHNLQSVFCRIDLADRLYFIPNSSQACLTDHPHVFLDCDPALRPNNLIVKAAHALSAYATTKGDTGFVPICVRLEKHIPMGAGLGGGSSNAATTLIALNRLWQLDFDTATLIQIAVNIGADVPFFVLNHAHAISEGVGDILSPIDLPAQQFLVLHPLIHNSTARFFAHPELKKDSPSLSHSELNKSQERFLGRLSPPFYNAFEKIALRSPVIFEAYRYLEQIGKYTNTTPRLTGTGSSVFLPLPQSTTQASLWQKNAPCPATLCQTK